MIKNYFKSASGNLWRNKYLLRYKNTWIKDHLTEVVKWNDWEKFNWEISKFPNPDSYRDKISK